MKSVLSLEEIQSAASAMRKKIKALKVSYEYTSTPTEAEKEMRPVKCPARDQRGTFAIRDSLQSSELEGLEDGKRIRLRYVMDGTHIAFERESYAPSSSVARTDRFSKSQRSQFVHREPFCLMADIRYSDSDRFAGGSWEFPHVLSLAPNQFHVRENQEKVGDRWCHVIECPKNAHRVVEEIGDGEVGEFIWVDSDNPAIMVKKESCFTLGGEFFPLSRKMLSDFRDIGEGVWLPMVIREQGFPYPRWGVKAGTLISESACIIKEFKLNGEVVDEDFEYRVHEGEGLDCLSTPVAEGEGNKLFKVWAKTDPKRSIAMPLDQPANETIKRLIMEKDPLFFS